jgi:hypothetical protein
MPKKSQSPQPRSLDSLYFQPVAKTIWNKEVSEKNFKLTDFNKTIAQEISKLWDSILFNAQQKQNIEGQYLRFNVALLSFLTAISASGYFLHSFFVCTAVLIVNVVMCFSWRSSINVLLKLNTTCFSAIKELEKKMPTRFWFTALTQTLHFAKNRKYREHFKISLRIPMIFIMLYCALYIYDLHIFMKLF